MFPEKVQLFAIQPFACIGANNGVPDIFTGFDPKLPVFELKFVVAKSVNM